MPLIGIVRGVGEGYVATGYIIKLIKALNRRFRSKIQFEEIPCGSYELHGAELPDGIGSLLYKYDCILIGDFHSPSNNVYYTQSDIAHLLSANTEYTYISAFDTDLCIASYFDGGFKMREGSRTVEGCMETRVCSAFTMSNIVKNVTRLCEKRRRRLSFVKDSDNEYCADMFYRTFESFALPLSNFQIVKYTPREICRDLLYDMTYFDVIFSSTAFSETVLGIFEYKLKDKFAFYRRYNGEKPIYAVRATGANSHYQDYVPSLGSYIIAFTDLIKYEFNMTKEAAHLCRALEEASTVSSFEEGDKFVAAVIEALQKPVTTKYSKTAPKSRYIK